MCAARKRANNPSGRDRARWRPVVYFCRAAVPAGALANSSACLWCSRSPADFLAGKFFTPGAFPFLASRSNCFKAYFSSSATILA
jgi:hypothetical protein